MNAIGAHCLLKWISLTTARPETGAFSTARRYGAEVEPLPERSGADKLIALVSASYDPFRPTHQLPAVSRPCSIRGMSGYGMTGHGAEGPLQGQDHFWRKQRLSSRGRGGSSASPEGAGGVHHRPQACGLREEVVACVVSCSGARIEKSELGQGSAKFVSTILRAFKEYIFIEALPKNNHGKVLKTELRSRQD
jgi:hypothetical protein